MPTRGKHSPQSPHSSGMPMSLKEGHQGNGFLLLLLLLWRFSPKTWQQPLPRPIMHCRDLESMEIGTKEKHGRIQPLSIDLCYPWGPQGEPGPT